MSTLQPTQESILITTEESELHPFSLVLSAANISHHIRPDGAGRFLLIVAKEDFLKADYELHQYLQENKNWPPNLTKANNFSPLFKAHSMLLIGLIALFYLITGSWSDHSVWFQIGSANSAAILEQAEYFRLITSLTLHADIVHLLGNCFLGGVLMHYYMQITGNGIGTFSMLLASIAANFLNAVAHGPGHNSVGFSTAVFAVIGILSMLNYNQYRFSRPIRVLMPLMAGMALLAMLGSSGERTDLGAHFFGLIMGFFTGGLLIVLNYTKWRRNTILQLLLAVVSLGLTFAAWLLALT